MEEHKKSEPAVEDVLKAQIKELREAQLKLGSHSSRKYMKLTKQIADIASLLFRRGY